MARLLTFLLLLLLVPTLAASDVVCDGVDDDFSLQLAASTFVTATTGSLVVVYVPIGTTNPTAESWCFDGEEIIADGSAGPYVGIFRHPTFGGGDGLCAYNFSGGTSQDIPTTYTASTRVHLTWVHSGGQLLFYKNGTLVAQTASGTTDDVSHTLRLCGGVAAVADGSNAASARIVEVKTYNVALTAAVIGAEGKSAVRNVIPTAATGRWDFDTCPVGSSGQDVFFPDRSGNGRAAKGSAGTNATGATCQASSIPYPWGVW
jgi:Concanavalin A-like lectin/glucanases superfamily